MRRRPLLVTVCLALTALALLAAPARAGAATRPAAVAGGAAAASTAGQEPDAPADDGTGGSADDDGIVEPIPGDDIIPEPDSGREPEEAGDRGGALQIVVFVLIVSGVGGMVAMIVRESRRNRAHQT